MPGGPGDPGHNQGRLPPRHLHPGNFLRKQVADIKRIGDFLTKMKRVGTGLGVHMVDRDIAAFINTRKAHTEVRIGNYTVEEDVNKIVNYGGNYLANMFTEKLWL